MTTDQPAGAQTPPAESNPETIQSSDAFARHLDELSENGEMNLHRFTVRGRNCVLSYPKDSGCSGWELQDMISRAEKRCAKRIEDWEIGRSMT